MGGVALLRASEGLKKLRTQNDDQKTGVEIVRKALSWPKALPVRTMDFSSCLYGFSRLPEQGMNAREVHMLRFS